MSCYCSTIFIFARVLPEMGNLRAQETNQLWDLGERMNYGGNSTGPNFSGGAVSVPAKMALGVNDGNWRSGATVQEQRTYTPLSQFLNSKGLPLRPVNFAIKFITVIQNHIILTPFFKL